MLAVVASRDIKKGEEVLAAYGAGFWVKFGV
jgi:SET domain-containing protein